MGEQGEAKAVRSDEQERALYGQHENRVYWLGGLFFLGSGMIGGFFIAPEEWPLWRQLAAGGLFGVWCGYCIFAWRLLFYGTVKEDGV